MTQVFGQDRLQFSHKAGFYTKPIALEIRSDLGFEIRYTRDGSIPTNESALLADFVELSYRYNEPNQFASIKTAINGSWEKPSKKIDKAHVLKCASFRNGQITSEVYAKTYFVDSLIFERYTMPVMSLITDGENFFSRDSGIYVPGAHYQKNDWNTGNYYQRGSGWERPVYVEYFSSNGELNFSQNAGVRIHGSVSRRNAQKSLRIYARNEYGEKYFNYPLLPHREADEYKRIMLRASTGEGPPTLIKDLLAHELSRPLNLEIQTGRPVIVFLNGEYWGIHDMRDRQDDRYIEYVTDYKKEEVLLISNESSNSQEMFNFLVQNDFSENENYNAIQELIDIENYINYMIAETFFGNRDWPGNNVDMWRPRHESGKWRWLFFDIDRGYDGSHQNIFDVVNDIPEKYDYPPITAMLFHKLIQNEDFVLMFVSRYAENLNTHFANETTTKKLDSIENLYHPEIASHVARWNDIPDLARWEKNVGSIRNFLNLRPCILELQLRDFFNLEDFGFSCIATDIPQTQSLKVIPNPNSGLFFINSTLNDSATGSLIVVNNQGIEVKRSNGVELKPGKNLMNINNLSAGVYILTFQSDELNQQLRIVIE